MKFSDDFLTSLFSGEEFVIGTRGGISFDGTEGTVLEPDLESLPVSFFVIDDGRLPLSLLPDLSGVFSLSFFSRGGIIGFAGVVSFPILLHV